MNKIKILKEIKILENDFKKLNKKLNNHNLIKSQLHKYLICDKESFNKLWKEYISFFNRLKKLIRKTRYRKIFIFISYDKLVLRRYILIFYYNSIIVTLKSFWKHEKFLRTFLDENFLKDYWIYAKYIYRPSFINLINTPAIFIKPFKTFINPKIFKLIYVKKINTNNRIIVDYNNIFYYIKYRIDKLIFILSKKIGFYISNTRFTTRNKWFITKKNLNSYLKIAKPWDILLTRKNRNASNASIPWFWKHMSMYIWNGKFLKKNFDYKFIKKLNDKKDYIIEATWKWIKLEEIQKLVLHNDYLWVSRTNFKKEKILRSIKNSLWHVWKSYDHIFNFYSDNNLVCTELILKSYAKEFKKDEWIEIDLESIWISLTYPPNKFIQKMYKENKKWKDSVVFPIFFIDSIKKTWENFVSSKKELLKSGKRSKFTFFLIK